MLKKIPAGKNPCDVKKLRMPSWHKFLAYMQYLAGCPKFEPAAFYVNGTGLQMTIDPNNTKANPDFQHFLVSVRSKYRYEI